MVTLQQDLAATAGTHHLVSKIVESPLRIGCAEREADYQCDYQRLHSGKYLPSFEMTE
jgi:hypothetical protein